MSGSIKNCDGPFIIYYLIDENYIGITTNIKTRINRHRYDKRWKCNNVKILSIIDNFEDAITFENEMQIKYNCPVSKVKNQKGINNPIATKIKHIPTGKIYNTVLDAANDLGLNYGSIRNKAYRRKMQLVKL
jgi:predicted GIY-YIG superfamily endonuclease